MSKLVLTSNDTGVIQKVTDFANLLGVQLEVKAEGADVLPFSAPAPVTAQTMAQLECDAIKGAVARYKGNLSEAAKSLGIGRATLYRKLKEYQIETRVKKSA